MKTTMCDLRLWLAMAVFVVAAVLGGCRLGEPPPPPDGESHFLKSCQASCGGGLTCICGVCTLPCDAATTCSALSSQAMCLPALSSCTGQAVPGSCQVACENNTQCASAGADSRCDAGRCVRGAPQPCAVVDLSMGRGKDCVLHEDGVAICWKGAHSAEAAHERIEGLNGATRIAAGSSFACALAGPGGALRCWGELPLKGQMANAPTFVSLTRDMNMGPFGSGVVDVQASGSAFCAIKNDDSLWCWGGGWSVPVQVDSGIKAFSMGASAMGGVNDEIWTRSGVAMPWVPLVSDATNKSILSESLSVNGAVVSFVEDARRVRTIDGAWEGVVSFPQDVFSVSVPVSQHFICAHGSDLFCWGSMDVDSNAPIKISSLEPQYINGFSSRVVKIATGFDFVCALNTSKEVWCFGRDVPGTRRGSDGSAVSIGLTKLDVCPAIAAVE